MIAQKEMEKKQEELNNVIREKRNTLKTDRLDMSFGELMNLYNEGHLFITPEYQRVFRWSNFQKTRFLESILLGVPIPPIFVAEDDDGKWELVDGLQRISTVFSFFGILKDNNDKNNFELSEGELIKELDGFTSKMLSTKLELTIKRSVCRVEIVKWDSTEDMRYELFNRLNTGASPLSDQEIRNCIFRAYPVNLNQILRDISKIQSYQDLISPTKTKQEQMFLEELVLRYFAFKYLDKEFKTTIANYLNIFMKDVSNNKIPFNLELEKRNFIEYIEFLNSNFGKDIFRPKGLFALHIFDSLAYAIPKSFDNIENNKESIINGINILLKDDKYNSIGTSTFSNMRIRKRMDRAFEIFNNL